MPELIFAYQGNINFGFFIVFYERWESKMFHATYGELQKEFGAHFRMPPESCMKASCIL